MVVAIKRASGETLVNPGPDVRFAEGDMLIVVGTAGVSARMAKLAASG